jgi:glycerate kinase
MPLRVLIIPDKFKGTLTAPQAAEAIAAGWREGRPADELELLPMSDGGDGFGEILGRHLGAEPRTVETVDAAHRPLQATWWWAPRFKTAIIESARIVGLALLPPGRFHPFELDSYGLGAVLRAAAQAHPRLCLVGLGGSATNDAGFGLARALGWQFLDQKGRAIEPWTQLTELARVVRPKHPCRFKRLEIAVDVRNRLLGGAGATRVFGPQKGIRPEDIRPAERCLRRLRRVLREQLRFPYNPADVPGVGAAGGLGFGLCVFVGASLISGFRLFSAWTELKQRLRDFQLVITGEGALDETTILMGKGVGRVAHLARRRRIPCLGLAGVVGRPEVVGPRFTQVHSIAPDLASGDAAMATPALWLRELARRTARAWPETAPPAAMGLRGR